jgi:hypothetical protein
LAASSFESRSGYPTEIIKIIKTKIRKKNTGGHENCVCVGSLDIQMYNFSSNTKKKKKNSMI